MPVNINLLYINYHPSQDNILANDCLTLLSSTDVERFNSIRCIGRKSQFLLGRLLVAKSVSNVLGFLVLPSALSLRSSGCPYFPDYPDLSVNISHSKQRVMACCGRLKNLGLDVEWQDDAARPLLKMAQRSFSADEYQSLAKLSSDKLTLAFYQCWTRYEARIKANIDSLSLSYIQNWQEDNYQHCLLSSEEFKLEKHQVNLDFIEQYVSDATKRRQGG